MTRHNFQIELVLDTGAGISIAGMGLEQKYDLNKIPRPSIEPVDIKITGVNSGVPIKVAGLIRVPIYFPGPPALTLLIPGVLVREWKGDLFLSWRTLMKVGFNFKFDKDIKPTHVLFHKYNVEIPLKNEHNVNIKAAKILGIR